MSSREVLDLLLKQLGYPSTLADEVTAAWLAAIATWRAAKALDERNLAALRLYVETANMAEAVKTADGAEVCALACTLLARARVA